MPKIHKYRSKRQNYKHNYKTRKITGGISTDYDTVFQGPSWQDTPKQWTTLVKLKDMEVYGSSIPHEDIYKCLATLKFYMHVKGIKRIISLQACGITEAHKLSNCKGVLFPGYPDDPDNKIDTDYERRIWNSLKQVSLVHSEDAQIEFVDHKIVDMRAGTISTWIELCEYDFNDPDQSTLIHCLAGFGRTTSVLLFICLDQFYSIPINTPLIFKPHLGYVSPDPTHFDSGFEMLLKSVAKLYSALEVDFSINTQIEFDKKRMFDEFTKVDTNGAIRLSLVNLLIARMNYIIICLANKHEDYDRVGDIKNIYLYPLQTSIPNAVNPMIMRERHMFSRYIEVPLNQIDTIAQNPQNAYGIKP